jgi:amidohydrolase
MRYFRTTLHKHPELSGHEVQTAGRIHQWLAPTQPDELHTQLGGHGLLARYRMAQPGPSVLFRADMDALPIPDEIDAPHRSQNEGIGHKCGHDGHTAHLLGLAQLLAERPFPIGEVALLFQPAEETGAGAAAVLQEPIWRNYGPDWVFGLHNLPGFPMGQVLTRDDVFAAASVGYRIELFGSTAHAADPFSGRSPSLALQRLAGHLQAHPQPHNPLGWNLATLTHMRLGEATFGTSPGYGLLQCTLRSDDDQALDRMCSEWQPLARRVADAYHLRYRDAWLEPFPAVRNDPEATGRVRRAAATAGLAQRELTTFFRWSEDFGHLTQPFRAAFFGIGSGKAQPALHDMRYDYPDALLSPGLRIFYRIAEDLLTG